MLVNYKHLPWKKCLSHKTFQSYEIKIYEDQIAINEFHHLPDAIERYTKLKRDTIEQMNLRCGYCLDFIGGTVTKLEALSS